MSAAPAFRRLGTQCLFCKPLAIRSRALTPAKNKRAASDDSQSSGKPNPILEEYLRNNPSTPAGVRRAPQQTPQTGDISPSSIFEDARQTSTIYGEEPGQIKSTQARNNDESITIAGKQRDPNNVRRVLDVDHNARVRWERKKVIQMVRNGGRLSRQQTIKRTEREHLIKSHMMKTSVKKLGMLARQIAGKTIDDAITQMRFSKKKVAIEVLKQLERARDEAVVTRGMGLGGNPVKATLGENGAFVATEESSTKPFDIQLKDGSRYKVKDPSTIYIDQAWVGRGSFGRLPDYRARGRMYVLKTPWTSLSVVLKEDHTRVREHAEREAKRRRQKVENPWVHLPDRPVQWQRQWYTF